MNKVEIIPNIENAETFFKLIKAAGVYELVLFCRFTDFQKDFINREKKTDFENVKNKDHKAFCQNYIDLNKAIDELHKAYANVELRSFEIFVETLRQDYEILDKITKGINEKQKALKKGQSKEQNRSDERLSNYKSKIHRLVNKCSDKGYLIDRDIEYNTIKNLVQDTLRGQDLSKMLLRDLFIYYFKICNMSS